jgi:hypothetical protein
MSEELGNHQEYRCPEKGGRLVYALATLFHWPISARIHCELVTLSIASMGLYVDDQFLLLT